MNTIRLSPLDNIVVLTQSLPSGSKVLIGDTEYVLGETLGLGHKLAARNLRRGEKIIKYGAPIGSAICDIPAGSHVHLHNLKSDYLPTFTLDAGREFHAPPKTAP